MTGCLLAVFTLEAFQFNDFFNQSNSIGDTFAEIEGKRDKSIEFVVKYPEEIYKE